MSRRSDIMKNFEKYRSYTEDRVKSGIESNRKAHVTFTVKNQKGEPIPGLRIQVSQKTHAFRYGANIFMLDELETAEKNHAYKESFKGLFNMATLPFYWKDLEPERGKLRYAADSPKIYRRPAPDLCLDFCEKNGIEPREHALAYAGFFPNWLKNESIATVKRELERRFSEISERYAARIPTIEVTNEMQWEHSTTAFYRDRDYVRWCFKLAEKYFPNNQLVINEWMGLWETQSKYNGYYFQQIENNLRAGARIDAVGMQFHMFFREEEEAARTVPRCYNPLTLYDTMDTYAAFGLPLQITEVTIPAYSNNPEDEELQADIIDRLYSIWFSHPNMEQIIYWNLVDGYAYGVKQGDMTGGENYYHGGLLRYDLSPKPAYLRLQEMFGKRWHTEEALTTDADGAASFKGFHGTYDVTISDQNGKTVVLPLTVSKDPVANHSIVLTID